MYSAEHWPQPPPSASLAALQIRPDSAACRRWLTITLVANILLALVCLGGSLWAASSSLGAWSGFGMIIVLANSVFQMVFHAFYWGRMLGTDVLAEVGPEGISARTNRWEPVVLPWSAIQSVTKGWNRIVVTPVPGAGPKISFPTRAVAPSEMVARQAIGYFSGGRL